MTRDGRGGKVFPWMEGFVKPGDANDVNSRGNLRVYVENTSLFTRHRFVCLIAVSYILSHTKSQCHSNPKGRVELLDHISLDSLSNCS